MFETVGWSLIHDSALHYRVTGLLDAKSLGSVARLDFSCYPPFSSV